MRTIEEYLSGQHDEELDALTAETLGWTESTFGGWWVDPSGTSPAIPPAFSTSRDACQPFLAGLTDEEWSKFDDVLIRVLESDGILPWPHKERGALGFAVIYLQVTARQICVAYLLVKGVMGHE